MQLVNNTEYKLLSLSGVETSVQRIMTASLTVHPKNVPGRVLLNKAEIVGFEKRVLHGKEKTLVAVGDLEFPLILDLSDLRKVEQNSLVRS